MTEPGDDTSPVVSLRRAQSLHIDGSPPKSRRTTITGSRIPVLKSTPPASPTKQNSNEAEAITSDSYIINEIVQGRTIESIDDVSVGLAVSDQKPSWKLKSLHVLNPLVHLVSLDVSGHGIYTMDGIDVFVHLVHLNIARNNLKSIKLSKLDLLESLDLSGNYITQIPKSLQQLSRLQVLNLSGNNICVLKQIDHLTPLLNLQTLNLSANPMSILNSYREYVIFTLPALSTLDELQITEDQREKSRRRFTGPLSDDELRREADKQIQMEQFELETKQNLLETENQRLKSELHVKSQLLDNKSKEWTSATQQLLLVQQELAMIHIDKNHPESPTHHRYNLLQRTMNEHFGVEDGANEDGEANEQDNSLQLVHRLSVLQQSQKTIAAEKLEIDKEILAIQNEIVLLDNDINILKLSLVGEQHSHEETMADMGCSATYYYDDGRSRLEELQSQIAFADVETRELEQKLVRKTKEMLAVDLTQSVSNHLDKRHTVFDKEISALSYKLERMTTQKAEWIDELHRLQASTQLPVLRLKESITSPRHSLRQTFRLCDETPPPPETNLFRLLISEKLEQLQTLQQRRLDLVDLLMTREANQQVVEDHLIRIKDEIEGIQQLPIEIPHEENKVDSSEEVKGSNGKLQSYALTSPQVILDEIKNHVLEHVNAAMGKHDQSTYTIEAATRPPPLAKTKTQQIYCPEYVLATGVDFTSANFSFLSKKTRLMQDIHTKLLLACKNLQQAQIASNIDAATNFDINPKTNRPSSRLQVSLLTAVNLPRTRKLYSAGNPYTILYLQHQNSETGQWQEYHHGLRYQSKTKEETLFPVWEEDFVFEGIDSMSTRLCIDIMDEKKGNDRHPKIASVQIDVESLWEQKRTNSWHKIQPILPPNKPQPAIRLRLKFSYNKVDRLRRIVDKLAAEYVAERQELPPFLCKRADVEANGQVHIKTSPPFVLNLQEELDEEEPSPPIQSKMKHLSQRMSDMETYREIFETRKLYRRVKARHIAGCFDRDSPYHPKQIPFSTKQSNVNYKIFKQPSWTSRDTTQGLPERYFGLTTEKSERLKEMFNKMGPTNRGRRHQVNGFQYGKSN